MKKLLNAKVVGWVYVTMGLLILAIQFYRTTSGVAVDWLRFVPGVLFLIIGVIRLVNYKPID
jgi:hypothetical protein